MVECVPSMCKALDSIPRTTDFIYIQIAKIMFGGVHVRIRRCAVWGPWGQVDLEMEQPGQLKFKL